MATVCVLCCWASFDQIVDLRFANFMVASANIEPTTGLENKWFAEKIYLCCVEGCIHYREYIRSSKTIRGGLLNIRALC